MIMQNCIHSIFKGLSFGLYNIYGKDNCFNIDVPYNQHSEQKYTEFTLI